MIEDTRASRGILAWWIVAACVAPCVAQQGSGADAPTQQPEPDVNAAEAERRFADGDYRGAAVAFGKRLESRRDDAALLYNLALSSWRAGELDAAEDAIDRYAAAPAGGRPELHHGLLGNIRYRQAEALVREANGDAQASALQPRAVAGADPAPKQKDPIESLEAAAGKARTARDEFVRAAGDGAPTPEIMRNAERAVRLLQDIEKQIEELKKQRDEQKKQDGKDQQQKDEQKKDEQKKEEQKQDQQQDEQKQDDKQQGEQKQDPQQKDDSPSKDQPPQGQERPEPKPDANQQDKQQEQQQQDPAKDAAADEPKGEGEQKPEPKPQDSETKDQPQDAQQTPRGDAPGEQVDATQLSPEQRARLMEQLKGLDARMREIRMQSRSRRPVDRDW